MDICKIHDATWGQILGKTAQERDELNHTALHK